MPYKDPIKQKQAQHESYLRNKDKVYKNSRMHIQKNIDAVISFKMGKPCADCGVMYPGYVMDLDHRDSTLKDKAVSQLVRSGGHQRVLNELEKCDVVCANCHRERTYQGKLNGTIPIN